MSTIKALLGNSASASPSITSKPLPLQQQQQGDHHTPSVPRLFSPAPLTISSATSSPDPSHSRGTPTPPHLAPAQTLRPKPKIIKDAPIFTPSSPRGPVRFPPHVSPSSSTTSITSTTLTTATVSTTSPPADPPSSSEVSAPLSAYHAHFLLYPPPADIALYPRHIPYNSEKRVFVNATGRDFFEVFQYTFRVPGGGASNGAGSQAGGQAGGQVGGQVGGANGGGDDGGQGQQQQQEGKAYAMLWDYNTGLVRTTPLFKCCGYGKVCSLSCSFVRFCPGLKCSS